MEIWLEEVIEVLSFGLILSLVTFCPVWAPDLVFRDGTNTDNSAAKSESQWRLADFFVVMFQVALGNVSLSLIKQELQPSNYVFLQIMVSVFIGLTWLRSLQFMRQRGVWQPWQRLAVQAIFFPLSIFCVAECLGALFYLLVASPRERTYLVPIMIGGAAWLMAWGLRKSFSLMLEDRSKNTSTGE